MPYHLLAHPVCWLLTCSLAVGGLAASATAEEPGSVTFGAVAPRVGDRVDQQIHLQLLTTARVRRGAELLKETESDVVNAHRRRVTTTEISQNRSIGVTINYGKATDEVIAGKTYHCRRDGEALRIVNQQGQIPEPAEFKIVARHMKMLGKPNPLANFLRGKTIAPGQTLEVPGEIAAALFGSRKFDNVERFRLMLDKTLVVDGQPFAKFKAEIHVTSLDGSQTRIEIAGPMVVEVATSQVTSTELFGPIAMLRSIADPAGRLQASASGRFSVSLQSERRYSLTAAGGDRWHR